MDNIAIICTILLTGVILFAGVFSVVMALMVVLDD